MSDEQLPLTIYPVSDFIEWRANEQLEIAPWFQRRSVWTPKARSYLIDTILRGMPIPPVFIRLLLNVQERRSFRQVVDGQQRIRAILDYLDGQFAVLKVHNPTYANMRFDDLPSRAKEAILSYKLPVYALEGASDADVLRMFARLNTYTIPLNKQEHRNAEYFGEFKQLVYEVAYQHLAFWRSNKILRDQQIARMADAELVSELLVTVLAGFQTTKDRDLRHYYELWDDRLPEKAGKISQRFERTIESIAFVFDDDLSGGQFRRVPLFFSLFCLFYDGMFGIPKSKYRPFDVRTRNEALSIRAELDELGRKLRLRRAPKEIQPFIDASRRASADAGRRRTRHDFLRRAVRAAIGA